MQTKLIQISFFNGDEVQHTEVLRSDLPKLSGSRTFWLPTVLASEALESTGRKLKQRVQKTLKHNALFKCSAKKK